ncbi:THEM4 [Scenedesmus sp. PABB004]|nr:THEM4 [Scenedesmus sp. PABB004]
MFGRHLLRGWRAAWGGGGGGGGRPRSPGDRGGAARPGPRPQPRPAGGAGGPRNVSAAAAAGAGAAGGLVAALLRGAWGARFGAAAFGGGAATATAAWKWRGDDDADAGPFETAGIAWVDELARRPGMREMLVPGQQLRKHPVGQLLTEDDHLFETMRRSEQVKEFRCFYSAEERKFYSVVMLGKDVCGYPSTVHGGLTAALVDESFGGLYTALLTTGRLGATLPGLTARLELDYKRKIPAGTVLLITTEVEAVEPRKVWMRAGVSDGRGTTFAAGRALFVAPNLGKQFAGLLKWRDGAVASSSAGAAPATA